MTTTDQAATNRALRTAAATQVATPDILLVPAGLASATCIMVHQATPCGAPATTVGRTGNHHDDLRAGPLCATCAAMQAAVMNASHQVEPSTEVVADTPTWSPGAIAAQQAAQQATHEVTPEHAAAVANAEIRRTALLSDQVHDADQTSHT